MSKTIKLEDSVYDKLTGLMGPKETYSQVVGRVLTLFDRMGELRGVLEGMTNVRQEQKERLEQHRRVNYPVQDVNEAADIEIYRK